MYNFFVQAWSTYKGLFYWLNWPGYISSIILFPAISVLTYAVLGRFALDPEAARYYALGVAVSSLNFVLIGGLTQTFSYERQFQTISFLYISSANRVVNFASRAIFHYPNALIAFASSMITLKLITPVDFAAVNWAGFIPAALISAASICAFAEFLGVFSTVTRDWQNTMGFSVGVVFALSGIIIPLNVFPGPVQELAKLLPITNGLTAIRGSFSGAPFSEVYWGIIREALTGTGYLALGSIGFVLFERIAKRNGAIETETYG